MNATLTVINGRIQVQIDGWRVDDKSRRRSASAELAVLRKLGYLDVDPTKGEALIWQWAPWHRDFGTREVNGILAFLREFQIPVTVEPEVWTVAKRNDDQ